MINNFVTTTTSRRLIFNSLSNVAAHIVQAAVAFFMVPFFIHTLGKEKYGIWLLLSSIFAYRGTLSLGLNSAINRHIPVLLAKNDEDGIQKVVSMSMLYLYFVSIAVIIISLIIHRYIETWFHIPLDLVDTAKTLVLIVGFTFAIIMPLQMYNGVLSGLQRYYITNIATVVGLLVRTALLLWLLSKGYGLFTMGLLFGVCEIGIRVFQVSFAQKLLPCITFIPKKTDFPLLWQLMHYGTNTLLYTMSFIIVYKISDIIIGIFMTPKDITKYYIASASILAISAFVESFTAAIKPAVSDLDARNNEYTIRQIALLTQKYVLILLLPSMFFFLIMGKDFLRVWVGADFESLYFILIILGIGNFFRLLQYSNFLILVGKGQHRMFGVFAVFMAVLTIILSVFFVKTTRLGLTGIALSNLIPMVLICGLILPAYFNKKVNIPFEEHVEQVWKPAFISCTPAIIMLGIWKYVYPPDSWFMISAIILIIFSITMLCTYFWGLSDTERQRFYRIFIHEKIRASNKMKEN